MPGPRVWGDHTMGGDVNTEHESIFFLLQVVSRCSACLVASLVESASSAVSVGGKVPECLTGRTKA